MPRSQRLTFFALAIASGWFFFRSIPKLWPLVPVSTTVPHQIAESRARDFLNTAGIDVRGFDAAVTFDFDQEAIDHVDRLLGRDSARALTQRTSLVVQHVIFKRRGNPTVVTADVHPDGRVVGWERWHEDDDPGGPGDSTRAVASAHEALVRTEPLDNLPTWTIIGSSTRRRDRRTDRTITFERHINEQPLVRERSVVLVAGDDVSSVTRWVVVPDDARRSERVREGPRRALDAVGLLLLAIAVVGAFVVLLQGLRSGGVRIAAPALVAALVATGAAATQLFNEGWIMRYWDPLVPKWIYALRELSDGVVNDTWGILVLFVVIAAGDAIDRKSGAGRGESLWLLLRGRITNPAVGRAALNGFLVGLLCGGALALTVTALVHFAGASVALQPRGFFVQVINSRVPMVTSVLFFGSVAMMEELGYRFFGGSWLERYTGKRWIAIALPAIVYGLTHTSLGFLPPAEPFWARAFALTVVGAVWGWAFFRFDALTVVLSHLTADLFIFNWPRLSSDDHAIQAAAVVTVMIPLLPALLTLVSRGRRRFESSVRSAK